MLLNLVVVQTSVTGAHRVDDSFHELQQLTTAQRYFQEADMTHDALHADVLEIGMRPVLVDVGIAASNDIRNDVALYRANLARVDQTPLPLDLARLVAAVRPLQDTYTNQAAQIAAIADRDPDAALKSAVPFLQQFQLLEGRQADVTAAFAAAEAQRQARADRDQRNARWWLVSAAVGASLGFILLAYLLFRMGRALTEMASQQRDVAETLQHSLLPQRLPEILGVKLATRYLPGGRGVEVGGDWYDVIELPNGEVGLVMGDVVGHDLAAATVMGQLRNVLRAYAAEAKDPGTVLERLNRFCYQQKLDDMASCVYAVVNLGTRRARIANAGHYPPLLAVAGTGATFLETTPRPPIGAVREAHYPVTECELPSGAVLVMYTDGLVERPEASVDSGLEMLRSVATDSAADLDELADSILTRLLADETPHDDVALLVAAPAGLLGDRLDVTFEAGSTQLASLRRTVTRWLEEVGADEQESYDILVACSEAATNAIEHAYGPESAYFSVTCLHTDEAVEITIRDWGEWRSPRGQDRGRGRLLMEGLMDEVNVTTASGGTEVWMRRRLTVGAEQPADRERLNA